jgi:hypothetical protein
MCIRQYSLTMMVLVALLLSTACASLPSDRQVKQFLGLEEALAHNDVPAPPTPGTFVLQFGMGQTKRIVIRGQKNAVLGEVTDPQHIQAILGVLRTGTVTHVAGSTAAPQAPLQLDFAIGSPEHLVTAHYNPANNILQMYNVPTPAWPDHAVASYAMTPAFGAALQAALGTEQSSSTP